MKKFTPDLHDQALFAAMVYNDSEMTQWIMDRKENIDFGIHETLQSNEGITILQVAASRGYSVLVKILMAAGADLGSVRDGIGTETALHCATRHSRLDVMEMFIDQGANINSIDNYGRTPVKTAINYEKHDSLKLLASRGADLETTSMVDSYTPLMHAAFNNDHESISILLSFGAELNSTEESGNTALSIAVRRGNERCVQIFLDAGAESKARNKSWEKPFFQALSRPDMVDLFLSRHLISNEDCLEAVHLITVKKVVTDKNHSEKSLEMIHEYMKNKELESEPVGFSL